MKLVHTIRRLGRMRRQAIARPARLDGQRAAIQEVLGYPVQAKLRVGAPDDVREREADAVADRVMAAPDAVVQRKCAACEQEDARRHEEGTAPVPDDEALRKASGGEVTAGAAAAEAIGTGGQGQPLPAGERAFFEPRLGVDLGRVRVHADDPAARLSDDLAARAFTVGDHIYFGNGEYRPGSRDGRHLLAHELTHVIQQAGASTVQRQPKPPGPAPAAMVKTGMLATPGFGSWHYVAYLEDKKVLLGRNIKSSDGTKRIGSIPWITRNPGNITVSTDPESKVGPAPKEAFKQGAYAKGGDQNDAVTKRYAIFPTVAKGLAAIWPQLQVINKANGGQLTLIAAMKIFKGQESGEKASVKDDYVNDIMKFMVPEIMAEAPSLSEAQAMAQARRILYRPVKDLEGGNMEYEIARNALITKEGRLATPGVEYGCESGFGDNERGRYTGEQWADIERLKASAQVKAELRALLGCA